MSSPSASTTPRSNLGAHRRLLPGVGLSIAVSAAAMLVQAAEERMFGRAWLEALVLAILLGALLRSVWTPAPLWRDGVAFAAKTLLEAAVALLGASVSVQALSAVGPALLAGVALVVALAIAAGYGIGRALRLPRRLALLVACGNAICGNSAIAAVAPVIGAAGCDVAASIAFTAVLGVVVVLALPLAAPLLDLSGLQFGVLAGLTVYAVPQVLAATAPVGALAVQIGTLVKLMRVVMLGPVILALSVGGGCHAAPRPKLRQVAPWFIWGFLALAALRAAGLLPHAALAPASGAAGLLTVMSMAALGLGVDVRSVARAGAAVTLAAVASLVLLAAMSLGLIRLLGLA